jgi:hypothetical protein
MLGATLNLASPLFLSLPTSSTQYARKSNHGLLTAQPNSAALQSLNFKLSYTQTGSTRRLPSPQHRPLTYYQLQAASCPIGAPLRHLGCRHLVSIPTARRAQEYPASPIFLTMLLHALIAVSRLPTAHTSDTVQWLQRATQPGRHSSTGS